MMHFAQGYCLGPKPETMLNLRVFSLTAGREE